VGRIAEVAAEGPSPEAVESERRMARLRADRDRWKGLHDRLATDLADLEQRTQLLTAATASPLDPPRWLAPKRPSRHEAIVTAILSDTHWDERVTAAEIGGVNAYDRHIATVRLKRWATGLVEQATHYVHNVSITGATVMLGGDLLTGNLHDLAETNEDHLPGTLVYWSEQLAAALTLVADGLDCRVHVPVVVGNHGRLTYKPRTKGRARDNLDWLIGHMVAAHLKGDDRFTFAIGDDPDAWVQVYGTTYLLTHGDQAKGGGGIGGIWPPIMRLAARKRQRYGRDFIMVMGHWHQLIMAPGQGLIVNGSTKGYDEFVATVINAPPERPAQAAWLTTPEHGPTLQFPIFCDDRKAEGW
jgi:hypothetical protein